MTLLEGYKTAELRQYNEHYIHKTHFPDSTSLIRTQVSNICKIMRKKGLSIRSSTCDSNSSVGNYFQCALPESDIDYWAIIVENEKHKKPTEYVTKSLLRETSINKRQEIRVYSTNDLIKVANMTYQNVDKMFYSHNNKLLLSAAIAVYQQIFGTSLFETGLKEELELSSTILLATIPTLPKLDIHRKNVVRYALRSIFNDLHEVKKYILIRAHQLTTENVNFDLSVEGKHSSELADLANKGFFEISRHSKPYYKPLWI